MASLTPTWGRAEPSTLETTLKFQFLSLKYTFQCDDRSKPLGLQQFILRCIRPPQSQSNPNKFLKTSVCADGSQQLHYTNKIDDFYTKSLRITFQRTFLYLCCFLEFFMSESLFLDFNQEKLSCNAYIFKFLTVQITFIDNTNKLFSKES